MKRWLPYIILIVLFVFLFTGNVDAQCSQCKLLAQHGGDAVDDKIFDHKGGNNINTAILYIMLSPYVLIGVALFVMRKKIKKMVQNLF